MSGRERRRLMWGLWKRVVVSISGFWLLSLLVGEVVVPVPERESLKRRWWRQKARTRVDHLMSWAWCVVRLVWRVKKGGKEYSGGKGKVVEGEGGVGVGVLVGGGGVAIVGGVRLLWDLWRRVMKDRRFEK
jgi:hypothetical protein